jgi:Fe-S-cluster containining protein
MPPLSAFLESMAAAWALARDRYQAYELLLPGAPSFICQPDLCGAHCCRAFSVSLDDREVARMARTSTLAPSAFLECEDGQPITLPLVQPYLLARDDGACGLLRGLSCGQYAGRPDACRLYPHFVVLADPESGRPLPSKPEVSRRLVGAALRGDPCQPVPMLLRHVECPGFTGPPLDEAAWRRLFVHTARLQFRR